MRPHIAAVYAFARTADDFADEEGYTLAERHLLLDDWRARLRASAGIAGTKVPAPHAHASTGIAGTEGPAPDARASAGIAGPDVRAPHARASTGIAGPEHPAPHATLDPEAAGVDVVNVEPELRFRRTPL